MTDPRTEHLKDILSELRDVSKDRRRTAVMKLGMVGGEEALRALIKTVEDHDEDLIVRGRAAMMLGKLRDQRAVYPLIRALEAPGFQTPLYAAQALGQLGDERAIEPLILLASNATDKTREAALSALKVLGYDDEAQPEPEL